MKLKVKYLSFILFVLILSSSAMAQSGILRGKITDAKTGEPLIGATVLFKGTQRGTTSDLDGLFSFNHLKPGTYTITAQYVSFSPKTIANVKIYNGKVTVLNIRLNPVSLGLKEVIVKGKAVNRSEAAMLTMQKKSSNVIEGLSAQQMSKTGDSDAAGALKRVTGINVVDGKYVYIRGLNDRYSKTTLNNADIPGLDPNKYTVQMDIFPSSLIENIVVYKSFSPDLSGDFTGGLVNIETRDFPEQFILEVGAGIGYNSQATFNRNFIGYQGSTTDFLGFDNGFRSIPGDASGVLPQYPSDKQLLTTITESFNKIMAPVKEPSGPNGNISFAIGNQINIGKHQLGYIIGLSYKKENTFYQNGQKNLFHLGGTADSLLITDHTYKDTRGTKEYLWGLLGNITYKFSVNHKIGLSVFKNQSGISTARYLFGQQPSDDQELYLQTRVLSWMERSLNNIQLKGANYFPSLSRLKANWIGSFTYSYQNEPDMRFLTNSYYPNLSGIYKYSIQPSIYRVPARYYRYLNELNTNFKVNFILPLGKKENAPKLKFGGAYVYKHRNFNDKRIDYRFQFSQYVYDGNPDNFFSNKNIGLNYPGYDPATGINFGLYIQGNPGDDLRNSYTAKQNIGAAYTMIEVLLFNKLRVTTGVRFEHTIIEAASKDKSLKPGYLNNNDFLPALNFTYYLRENMNLRFNSSRTLARPSFRELAPYASQDFAGGEIYVGNSHLKRTLINNYDLRWEYYRKPGEVISVSAFYKHFTNPIELVDNPRAQNTELSWDNVPNATVYGTEIDIRKNLDFWKLTKNLKVGLNFTYVYSAVSIDSLELSAIRATDPNAKNYRPMNGQSPYILNVLLGYNNKKSGTEATLAYNVTGPKLRITVKGGTPNIYQQPFNSLNLVFKKQLKGNFGLTFKASNLLNAAFKETYSFKNKVYIYRKYKTGTTFEIGIKYKIRK